MSLSRKQSDFLTDFAKLIIYINSQPNMYCTAGELLRTPYQQQEYVRLKKSKTLKSKHLKKMAGDLNVFYNGKPLWNYDESKQMEIVAPIAEYWKSMHPKNVSGFDWGWDLGHFERG